ncbi:hypothetical protein HaLaN_25537, partial [Haematococcus lacustris]
MQCLPVVHGRRAGVGPGAAAIPGRACAGHLHPGLFPAVVLQLLPDPGHAQGAGHHTTQDAYPSHRHPHVPVQ